MAGREKERLDRYLLAVQTDSRAVIHRAIENNNSDKQYCTASLSIGKTSQLCYRTNQPSQSTSLIPYAQISLADRMRSGVGWRGKRGVGVNGRVIGICSLSHGELP